MPKEVEIPIPSDMTELKIEDLIPQIEGMTLKNANYLDIPYELLPPPSPIAMNNRREVNPAFIKLIREQFAKEYVNNKDNYDEEDLLRVMNSEWQVKRFLLHVKQDPKKAYEALKTTMRWRKTMCLSHSKDTDFADIIYRIGGAIIYGKDMVGNTMIILRIRFNKRVNEWMDEFKKL